jgi:hypothetical protein
MYKFTNQELVNDVQAGIQGLFSGNREAFTNPDNLSELTEKYGPMQFIYTNYKPNLHKSIPLKVEFLTEEILLELLPRKVEAHEGIFFLAHFEEYEDKTETTLTMLKVLLSLYRGKSLSEVLTTKTFTNISLKLDPAGYAMTLDWLESGFTKLSAIVLPHYQGFQSVIEIYILPDDFAETKMMLDNIFQKMIDEGKFTLSTNPRPTT